MVSTVFFDEFPDTEYEAWRKEANESLKGVPFEKKLLTRTYEGIVLEPIYVKKSIDDSIYSRALPGIPDYLRGSNPSGYIGKPWSIAQSVEDPIPAKANSVLRKELTDGADAVHCILDDITLNCADITKAVVLEEGERGVLLSTLKDMDDLLSDVDLKRHEIHMYTGASAAPLLGLIASRMRAQGQRSSIGEFSGCVGADPLGVLAGTGCLPCPLDELYDEMALTAQWALRFSPDLRTILVRADVYHEGGASAVQELACAFSTAIAYVQALQIRGLDINSIAGQIRFSFSLGANFFMEIAKLRVAKIFWAKIIQAFGGNETSQKIDLFVSTSRFTETIYDPYVNVLRATTQALSGVVGGVGGMNVRRFDDADRPATELSRRIAHNIQVLLQNEFDLSQPIDPAGGSWYVETLTQQLFEKSWLLMQRLEAEGGMVESLRSGFVQREIDDVIQLRFMHLNTRSDRAVGINMYANMTEQPLPVQDQNLETAWKSMCKSVEEYRDLVDDIHCRKQLDRILDQISGPSGEFVNALIEAFMAGATLSDVRKVLNDDFEGDIIVDPIKPHRWTEKIEAMRKLTENMATRTGETISVFLANMGPLRQHKARADFSAAFMEIAGFKVLRNDGFATVDEAIEVALESEANIVVICSTDETYPELVPPLARAVKAVYPEKQVILAGLPAPEYKDVYMKAGVDHFIHIKANCLEILEALQMTRGIC